MAKRRRRYYKRSNPLEEIVEKIFTLIVLGGALWIGGLYFTNRASFWRGFLCSWVPEGNPPHPASTSSASFGATDFPFIPQCGREKFRSIPFSNSRKTERARMGFFLFFGSPGRACQDLLSDRDVIKRATNVAPRTIRITLG